MKKRDMTKKALLGLTSALLLASQAHATDSQQASGTQLSMGCRGGGAGGCSAQKASNGCGAQKNYTAGRDRYTADADADDSSLTPSSTATRLSETQLLSQLSDKGRELYLSLDAAGRKSALDLANSGKYSDKNDAVKAAADQQRK